jgi:lysozyme
MAYIVLTNKLNMKKLLFVIFLLAIQNISFISDIKEEKTTNNTLSIVVSEPIKKIVPDYNKLYADAIRSIKGFEGLKLNAYLCPAGQKTIGYGHYVTPNESLPDSISLTQADSLLKSDFNKCLITVKKQLNGIKIDNKDTKILALAHFVYNVGEGNFERSTLLKLVKENKPIDEELLKWNHYIDKDKNVVTSTYMKQMRQYEVDLYNSVS